MALLCMNKVMTSFNIGEPAANIEDSTGYDVWIYHDVIFLEHPLSKSFQTVLPPKPVIHVLKKESTGIYKHWSRIIFLPKKQAQSWNWNFCQQCIKGFIFGFAMLRRQLMILCPDSIELKLKLDVATWQIRILIKAFDMLIAKVIISALCNYLGMMR